MQGSAKRQRGMDTTTDSPFEKWIKSLNQNIVGLDDVAYIGCLTKPAPMCKICESKSIKCGLQIASVCLQNITSYQYNATKKKLTLFSSIEKKFCVKNVQVAFPQNLKTLSNSIGMGMWTVHRMYHLRINTRCRPKNTTPLEDENSELVELSVDIMYSCAGLEILYVEKATSPKEKKLRSTEVNVVYGTDLEEESEEESES
jgi:hypothetical protein